MGTTAKRFQVNNVPGAGVGGGVSATSQGHQRPFPFSRDASPGLPALRRPRQLQASCLRTSSEFHAPPAWPAESGSGTHRGGRQSSPQGRPVERHLDFLSPTFWFRSPSLEKHICSAAVLLRRPPCWLDVRSAAQGTRRPYCFPGGVLWQSSLHFFGKSRNWPWHSDSHLEPYHLGGEGRRTKSSKSAPATL